MSTPRFSFCEQPMALILDQWHIRAQSSTEQHHRFPYTVQATSLCGKEVVWDVNQSPSNPPFGAEQEYTCPTCLAKYLELTRES